MTDRNLPTVEYLRKRLRYDPDTGKLYWLDHDGMPNNWLARFAGKEAFTSVNSGYRCGCINDRMFFAHRVIWALETGAWPEDQIDHINGDRGNNRLENLRSVSSMENRRNAAKNVNNTSGACGVCWNKNAAKWEARVWVNGKNICLGYFASFDDAVAVRKAASREHGFTERHGT